MKKKRRSEFYPKTSYERIQISIGMPSIYVCFKHFFYFGYQTLDISLLLFVCLLNVRNCAIKKQVNYWHYYVGCCIWNDHSPQLKDTRVSISLYWKNNLSFYCSLFVTLADPQKFTHTKRNSRLKSNGTNFFFAFDDKIFWTKKKMQIIIPMCVCIQVGLFLVSLSCKQRMNGFVLELFAFIQWS